MSGARHLGIERALDQAFGPHKSLTESEIAARTDSYFNRTRDIVAHYGDCRVTYAFFIRRPVVAAYGLMQRWLENVAQKQGFDFEIVPVFEKALG